MVAEPSAPHSYARVSRRRPCTKCGGDSGCEIRDDGQIHCLRVESAKPCKGRLGGWWHEPQEGTDHDAPQQRSAGPRAEVADADTLDAVYGHMLTLCPLSPAHRRLLRPLEDQQVDRYGTLPPDRAARRRILDQLIDTHGFATLLKVPGFALNDKKELEIRGAGIMLPTRDVQGRVVAIDIRREQVQDGQSRYYKLSSRSADDEGAPSPGAPAHVGRPAGGVTDTSKVYVTEGIKKADYLAESTGCVSISIPGIGNARAALEPIEELAGDIAILALDQDDPEKNDGRTVEAVARAREELAQAATELGYAVRIATWDGADAKGVDDLLLASKTFTTQRYTTTKINGDGSRLGTKTQLLGEITEVLHNWSLKPAAKVCHLTLLLRIHEAQQDRTQVPDTRGRYDIPIHTVAHEANISRNLAGTTVRELADDYHFFELEQHRDVKTGQSVTRIGLGPRRLSRRDKLPEPEHLERERQRKRRCPDCGSEELRPWAFICKDCGCQCTPSEAERAAKVMVVQEDGRLVDRRTGVVVGAESRSRPQPCTDSVHGLAGNDEDSKVEGPCMESVHCSTGETSNKEVRKQCTDSMHGTPSIHSGHLTAWLETNFVRTPSARTPADEVRAHYRLWCLTTHEEPCPWQVVESWLSESGAHLHHGERGPVWLGIGLLADDVGVCPDLFDNVQDVNGAVGTNRQQQHPGDDGVMVDLDARRAERDEAQAQATPVEGLFATEARAASRVGECSECHQPIDRDWGRCPPCRRAEYARMGMEEWR